MYFSNYLIFYYFTPGYESRTCRPRWGRKRSGDKRRDDLTVTYVIGYALMDKRSHEIYVGYESDNASML